MPGEKEKKMYCANCKNCKVVLLAASDGSSLQKVRCAAGHWKKPLGEEKLFPLATVPRRVVRNCPDYDEMGEPKQYMKELKKNLPPKTTDTYAD